MLSISSSYRMPKWTLVLTVLLVAVINFSTAQGAEPANTSRLAFSGGIEFARRAPVRDWYGTALTGVLGYEHRVSSRWGWAVDLKGRYSAVGDLDSKFLTVSLAPEATLTVAESQGLRLSINAGPGLGYRVIWVKFLQTTESNYPYSKFTVHQTELDLFAQAAAVAEIKLGKMALIGRFGFDRWLTGHPSQGDFGDTGGFCLSVGIAQLFGVK